MGKVNPSVFFVGLTFFLFIIFMSSLALGASSISITDVFSILYHWLTAGDLISFSASDIYIITELRLPRTLLAFLVGAALGVSGAVIQTLFRNPLADPSLIGVSSGAALAAASMLVFSTTLFINPEWISGLVSASAFVGGMLATLVVMRLGQDRYRMALGTLLLVGIAINALAMSGIGLLTYIANETTLRSLTFWMLGSLAQATWGMVGLATILIGATMIALPLYARPLNALLLGEAEAQHLGIAVEKVKYSVLLMSALAVGTTVAFAGIISFIGLVVPHMVRMLVGANHRYVLPGSILLGGSLLMLADIGARTLVIPAELPIGIITALLGAPFFLALIMRAKKS